MHIIGIVGRANVGKSTIAEYLNSNYNYEEITVASSLKDYVAKKYSLPRHLLEGKTIESRKWREEFVVNNQTPRQLLQHIATYKRNIDPYYWTKRIKVLDDDKNYVLSDCRFETDIEYLLSHKKSIIIKLSRTNNSILFDSENHIEDLYSDYEIMGDMEYTKMCIDDIIIKHDYYMKRDGHVKKYIQK